MAVSIRTACGKCRGHSASLIDLLKSDSFAAIKGAFLTMYYYHSAFVRRRNSDLHQSAAFREEVQIEAQYPDFGSVFLTGKYLIMVHEMNDNRPPRERRNLTWVFGRNP